MTYFFQVGALLFQQTSELPTGFSEVITSSTAEFTAISAEGERFGEDPPSLSPMKNQIWDFWMGVN